MNTLQDQSLNRQIEAQIRKKIEAQRLYCQERMLPHFAPPDGKCWSCGNDIYLTITLETASNSLITGCPHCHKSYCD